MTLFFTTLHLVLSWLCVFFAYQVIKSLLPIRKWLPIQIAAFLLLSIIVNMIIYLNDATNVVGVLLGFYLYVLVFFQGKFIPKISAVTILYPLIVSVNYMCDDIGSVIWFTFFNGHVTNGGLISTMIHTLSFFPRFFLWLAIWRYCKKNMTGIHQLLTNKTWLLLDSICAAVFIGLFVVLNFVPDVPEEKIISYSVSLGSIITVIGCFYLVVYIANSIQTNFQLKNLQMEYQYYEDKLKDEERVRAVYHDMKNHLLVIQAAGGSESTEEIISAMQTQISDYENYYKTGNTFLDVIIRDKAAKTKEHEIDFSAMLHFEDGSFIDPLDISAIFGNALDNAIEASLKLPVSKRLVTIKAKRIHDMLSIVIENHISEVNAALETTKQNKLLHGFGLKNIEQSVAKYDGQCTIEQKAGRFTLKIIIPIL